MFGLDHKYFLDDCVAGPNGRVLQIDDWYPSVKTRFGISRDIRERSAQFMRDAKSLLKKRLERGYYPKLTGERLAKKVETFDSWIKKVQGQ